MIVDIAEVRPSIFRDHLEVETHETCTHIHQWRDCAFDLDQLTLEIVNLLRRFPARSFTEDAFFQYFKLFSQRIDHGEIPIDNSVHDGIEGEAWTLTKKLWRTFAP